MSKRLLESIRTKPMRDYYDSHRQFLEITQSNFGKGRSSGSAWRRLASGILVPSLSPEKREPVSRQTLRAQLRTKQYGLFRIAGDRHRFPEGAQPLPRRERRALARAYAARDYAEIRAKKGRQL